MLTGLVIFSGIGTVCGGIIFQWRRTAANRKVNMFKVRTLEAESYKASVDDSRRVWR